MKWRAQAVYIVAALAVALWWCSPRDRASPERTEALHSTAGNERPREATPSPSQRFVPRAVLAAMKQYESPSQLSSEVTARTFDGGAEDGAELHEHSFESIEQRWASENIDLRSSEATRSYVHDMLRDLEIDGEVAHVACGATLCRTSLVLASFTEVGKLSEGAGDGRGRRWVAVQRQADNVLVHVLSERH
jgi:hypothetical protein